MAKLSAKYEILYIIDPAQGEEGIAALVEKFKGIVARSPVLTSGARDIWPIPSTT